MTVKRGEIWYAELSPTRGSEQAGLRPVLIVQNDAVNRFTTTVLAVPLTTNLRRAALPSCFGCRSASGKGELVQQADCSGLFCRGQRFDMPVKTHLPKHKRLVSVAEALVVGMRFQPLIQPADRGGDLFLGTSAQRLQYELSAVFVLYVTHF
jgi:mRNA interferase MazF